MELKYLSRQGIEQIGERVIKVYRNLPDNKKSTPYRVDLIKLIEEVLKVNLEYHHLSLDGTVLGVTTPFSGKISLKNILLYKGNILMRLIEMFTL